MRFQAFCFRLPDFKTLNISSSLIAFTFSIGTFHLPAFSFLFYFIMFDNTFVLLTSFLSNR